jgi:sorting nexin-41/42
VSKQCLRCVCASSLIGLPAVGDQPSSPPAFPPTHSDYVARNNDLSDDDEAEYSKQQQSTQLPRKGGYDGRIQQILYENADLEILIVDAGKSLHGNYIEYRIRTGDIEVTRRYSDFDSLRKALVALHPTIIIPPIPEKHTMADYAAKPTKAKEDPGTIDQRKRMLAVFLNRCRRIAAVLDDGVYWRFLDPNSSWNEVINSHPVSSVPKNILKAPPLDPANPTPAHNWLPVPSSSAKLKSAGGTSSSGAPVSPPGQSAYPSTAAHTSTGPQVFGRFPPNPEKLSESELDPYFLNFEAATRETEILMSGSIDKTNRRAIEHLTKYASEHEKLGARYNAFALSEPNPTVAAALEKVGQAADSTYLASEELALNLGANFAEPMRESTQFAGAVTKNLGYRTQKRVQLEMTKDELEKSKHLLESLERSEAEAKRIDAYLSQSTTLSPPRGSTSNASKPTPARSDVSEETASVDSDFPPTHGDAPSSPPSAAQGEAEGPTSPTAQHRKTQSGNFITNKVFGGFRHAMNGFADVDPERNRRDQIGKTREKLVQLEQALQVSEKDTKDASQAVMQDLKRFQGEKEEDLQKYMVCQSNVTHQH